MHTLFYACSIRARRIAYIEFQSQSGVENALIFSGSKFMDREIKVLRKRTNVPAFMLGRGGRGGRGGEGGGRARGGRGRGRGMPWPMQMPYMPFGMMMPGMFGMGGYRGGRGGRGAPRGGRGAPRGGRGGATS
jgi:hypothetical protein